MSNPTEQSRDMWCPMARVASASAEGNVPSVQAVFNRLDVNGKAAWPASANCIREKCAMWRFSVANEETDAPEYGYCGLAGRKGLIA